MPDRLTLWLPMPPKRVNSGKQKRHWGVQTREKNKYLRELYHRKDAGYLVPPPPAQPPERARVQLVYHVGSGGHVMDRDNAHSRAKIVLDWLVTNGYLAGDSDRHLELDPPRHVVAANDVPAMCSLRIDITPIEG